MIDMMKKKENSHLPIDFYCINVFFFLLVARKNDIRNDANTVTDIDGNIYHTVTIGAQVWMVENLKVTGYRNGESIGTTAPATFDISGETSPKYQWAYAGNESNVATYGRLYTWYAVTDSRNICPQGWHVPTYEEWTTLENFLLANGYAFDGKTAGNGYAKALASDSGWTLSTTNGAVGNSDYPENRNITGFTGFPGGQRTSIFNDIGNFGNWWLSSETTSSYAWHINLLYDLPGVYRNAWDKSTGFSVRCLQD